MATLTEYLEHDLPLAFASDGRFGRQYEFDAVELGIRPARALLWHDIALELTEHYEHR